MAGRIDAVAPRGWPVVTADYRTAIRRWRSRRIMVTLAWGNVLSLILPGLLTVYALRYWVGPIERILRTPESLTVAGGFYLLTIAALAGGVIEGFRRVFIDFALPEVMKKAHPGRDETQRSASDDPSAGSGTDGVFAFLTPGNLALFEAGVENSYKYYAFYSNLSVAILGLLAARLVQLCTLRPVDGLLVVTVVVLGYAAHLQLGLYKRCQAGFIEVEKQRRKEALNRAEKLATHGDTDKIA